MLLLTRCRERVGLAQAARVIGSSPARRVTTRGLGILRGATPATACAIAAIADTVRDYPPRQLPTPARRTRLSGIEPMVLAA